MSGTDYTTTPNLGLYKPIANRAIGQWGEFLNSNADTLDATMAHLSGGPFLPLTGGTVSGLTTFTLALKVGATGSGGLVLFDQLNGSIGATTNHIQMHSAGYGWGLTTNSLNYIVPSGGIHNFVVAGNATGFVDSASINMPQYRTPGNTLTGASNAMIPRLNMGSNLAGTFVGAAYVNNLIVSSDTADGRSGSNGGIFTLGINHNVGGSTVNGSRGLIWAQLNISSLTNPALEMTGINSSIFVNGSAAGAFIQPITSAIKLASGANVGNTLNEMTLTALAGSSVGNKGFLQFTTLGGDVVDGATSTGLSVASANSATTGSPGIRQLIAVGVPSLGWPMNPTSGAIIGVQLQTANQGVGRNIHFIAPQTFAGIDLQYANFSLASGYGFRSPGFSVDGVGQISMANAVLGVNATGAQIDIPNQIVTAVAVAAGGGGGGSGTNDYYVGDILFDTNGGQYRVATVTAGAVVTVTLLVGGVSASPPTNPRPTTGGSGLGCTLTLTWSAQNVLSLQPSGGTVQVGTGCIAANGSVATVLGSLGPVGSHAAVQEWIAIKNASGVTRYIPAF